ncbi:MAG: LytTR family DNA-binding domain-containing protein [Bacteroidota bacterium]|nr:LytTR family DNA-binding domain-containing protein [Bacteroidota bacterium]
MDSTNISAIIIDDETDAISLLEMYLRQFPYITVTGKETHAQKGLELAKETLPELVFLDIDMPEMNGLQVAKLIQSENFYSEIVFTTAYQHYAYDALGIEPLDFLTKPFCIDDLEVVIQKYNTKIKKKKLDQKRDQFIHSRTNSPKIKLPANHGVLIIDIKDIVILRSKGNNCDVYIQDGKIETITRNLYIVINLLNSPAFVKINRSTYININFLQRVEKKNNRCILGFNQTIHEETFSRNQMIYFEKLNLFPII